jgi:hypothetical protein
MRYHWDSWFGPANYNFKYNGGQVYNSRDINYIVGGHAFRQYGFTYEQMMLLFKFWKFHEYGHMPNDSALIATQTWLWKGWNEWVFRNNW